METVSATSPGVIDTIITVLQRGGLVVIPSDTVYGLSVDATNPEAVRKLIAFKSRVPGKAISVFVGSLESASKYVRISSRQEKLLESMLPGAFTIVLPSKHVVAKKVESERDTLGIRIPDYPLINKVVQLYNKPITATSANLSGRSPHYSIQSLLKSIPAYKRQYIDLIVDAGKLPRHKPSTVIEFSSDEVKILRKGDMHVP